MKIKWILPFALAAVVGFLAVPAFACGGHGQSADNETITASTEGAEAVPAAEPAAEPAAQTEHNCTCGHGQQAADEAAEEPADSDTTTADAPVQTGVTCPHAVEAAAADDDNS